MIIQKIILCAMLFGFIFGCHRDVNPDEELFKERAIELSNLLEELLKLRMNPQATPYPNGKRIMFEYDIEERDAWLNKTGEQWLRISNDLKQFALEYPDSKWADDAAFCRAIEFGYIRTSISLFKREKVSAVHDFISGNRDFEIEEWTKKRFAEIYGVFFSSLPLEVREALGESEIIRGGLYLLLISHFMLENEPEQAEEEIRNLHAEGLHQYFLHTAGKILKKYSK